MMKQRNALKIIIFSSLFALGISNAYSALPPPCSSGFIPSFNSVSSTVWDTEAVRKVVHSFAYGGFASDEQISIWANMDPQCAIQEILTFQSTNDLLSPPGTDPLYDNIQSYLTTTNGDASLEALQTFWSSSDSNNPTPTSQLNNYNLLTTGSDIRLNVNSLPYTWIGATNKRGVNPFRQKVGFWLTNYHMSVHMNAVGTNPAIIRRMYDDVMRQLSQDPEGDDINHFANVLSEGAKSAAIAVQYGHKDSRYSGTRFYGNDDFAREYHQLFFGILGDGTPQEQQDYENITVENTAKLLTGMTVQSSLSYYGTTSYFYHDTINFDSTRHYPATLSDLVILGNSIPGSSYPTAMDKLDYLSQLAIQDQESLENLPVWIIKHFSDDTLNSENDADPKVVDIRSAWQSSNMNLLHFLRSYAISDQFHTIGQYANSQRYKYRSAFDRNMTIYNQNTVDNEESYINTSANPKTIMQAQDAETFYPAHFVFGGQTGLDAANNPNIFKSAYNSNISNPNKLATSTINTWQKQWSKLVPSSYADSNGLYRAGDIGAWLWQRFIADGNANYGYQERFFVSGLLAQGNTFDPGQGYEEYELDPNNSQSNPQAVQQLLNNEDTMINIDGNRNLGLAINFITVTPYMFVQNSNAQGQGE